MKSPNARRLYSYGPPVFGYARPRFANTRANNRAPVAVITQPYVSDKHVEQQADLVAMLTSRFGDNSHVRYVNLGHVVDLKDREIAYDRIHLVASGNDRVAAELVAPVLDLLR